MSSQKVIIDECQEVERFAEACVASAINGDFDKLGIRLKQVQQKLDLAFKSYATRMDKKFREEKMAESSS